MTITTCAHSDFEKTAVITVIPVQEIRVRGPDFFDFNNKEDHVLPFQLFDRTGRALSLSPFMHQRLDVTCRLHDHMQYFFEVFTNWPSDPACVLKRLPAPYTRSIASMPHNGTVTVEIRERGAVMPHALTYPFWPSFVILDENDAEIDGVLSPIDSKWTFRVWTYGLIQGLKITASPDLRVIERFNHTHVVVELKLKNTHSTSDLWVDIVGRRQEVRLTVRRSAPIVSFTWILICSLAVAVFIFRVLYYRTTPPRSVPMETSPFRRRPYTS